MEFELINTLERT